MKPSDEKLIAALRQGDMDALDALLSRHERRVYRFALRLCGDEESAREVLQETLLAAFRNLPGFRGEAALSTWLYQIARSFCIKQRRAEWPNALKESAPSTAPTPEMVLHARQIGAALGVAIAALPSDYREALLLRDVEGLSAEEAARVAGVEVGALKSRLRRARLQLRRELAGLLDERK